MSSAECEDGYKGNVTGQIVDEGFTKISRKRARAPGEHGKKGGRPKNRLANNDHAHGVQLIPVCLGDSSS
jgi:hypothetical protein